MIKKNSVIQKVWSIDHLISLNSETNIPRKPTIPGQSGEHFVQRDCVVASDAQSHPQRRLFSIQNGTEATQRDRRRWNVQCM